MGEGDLCLYRKYRPKDFRSITGHKSQIYLLKNSINKGKIAHAYLFSGPRGTGKTSTALVFAKALNCLSNVKPCNKCTNCVEFDSGLTMDVIEMDAASHRKLQNIRDLIENVKFLPVKGKYKVYIIDEVHMLIKESFNALLKTLEEPPPYVVFILATTEPHQILPTVVSRCVHIRFRKLKVVDIISRLKEIALLEHIQIEEEALNLIARYADGSLRDALTNFEKLLNIGKDKIIKEDVYTLFGIVDDESVIQIIYALAMGDFKKAYKIFQDTIDSGKDPYKYIEQVLQGFYYAGAAKLGVNIKSIYGLSDSFTNQIFEVADKISINKISYVVTELINKWTIFKKNYVFEEALGFLLIDIFSNYTFYGNQDKLPRMTPKVEQIEKEKKYLKNQTPDLKLVWDNLLNNLKKRDIRLNAFMCEGTPIELNEKALKVRFKKTNRFHYENAKKNILVIENVLASIYKPGVKVELILEGSIEVQEKKKEFQDLKEHPVVRKVLDLFDGQIISVEQSG